MTGSGRTGDTVGPVSDQETQDNGRPRLSTAEHFADLVRDWRIVTSRLLEEAEQFARERPGVALTTSFFAGFLISRLFGGKR